MTSPNGSWCICDNSLFICYLFLNMGFFFLTRKAGVKLVQLPYSSPKKRFSGSRVGTYCTSERCTYRPFFLHISQHRTVTLAETRFPFVQLHVWTNLIYIRSCTCLGWHCVVYCSQILKSVLYDTLLPSKSVATLDLLLSFIFSGNGYTYQLYMVNLIRPGVFEQYPTKTVPLVFNFLL